jgi:alkylhydroperoxidase family enzyme
VVELVSVTAAHPEIFKAYMSYESYANSPEFSQVEKTVLDLATAMTLNPASVPDELFSQVQKCFEPVQVIEITAAIAWENYRSRFNHALRIESHGFSEGSYCVLPERKQTHR